MAKKPRAKAKPVSQLKERFFASKIVMRDPAELVPFPNNPKIHTPEQIESIACAIDEFGFDQPALIDENDTVLKGHGRRLACIKRGYQIPTIAREGLTVDDKIAIVLSDNQLPLMTGFDQALLRVNFTTLAKHDYPMQLTGFKDIHFATFIGDGNTAEKNQATLNNLPELAPAVSRAGDVWRLGSHRLLCGSCNDDKAIAKLFAEGKPRLMLTDPPYKAETAGGGIFSDMTHSQRMKRDDVHEFEVSDLCELLDTNVIFTSKGLLADYLELARERKLTWDLGALHRQAAVPNHNNHLMTDLDYVVMMGKIAPKRGLEHEDYSKLFSTGHWERPVPWAKPVELMERILRLFSDAGDQVFEPYCGSGTTLIAAEHMQRVCLAIEVKPEFVDLTIRRWQDYTKKEAVLGEKGRSFARVSADRGHASDEQNRSGIETAAGARRSSGRSRRKTSSAAA